MAPTVTDSSNTTATPTLDLLCLLDSYDVAHGSGRTSQRAGLWKIGTARREKGGFHLGGSSTSINALNVREELRARAVVEVVAAASEPPLVDEESSSKSTGKKIKETNSLFALHLDGMPKTDPKSGTSVKGADNEKDDDDDATLSTAISADADATSSTGLRQRKKNAQTATATGQNKTEEETSKWTEEVPSQNVKLTPEQLEEEKLRTANPLDLFGGLPPPSLRVAQIEAREALAKYVEAANYAAEIIRLTNGAEERQRQQKRNDEE
jgi:hypothetical protein